MTDLDRLLGPDFVAAISQFVDARVAAVLAEHELKQNGNGPTWISRQEASADLGISLRQLDRLVARGKLRSMPVGRRVLVSGADVEAFEGT
ncbi:MAG TPA: excisionase family DNA-binding protein [Gaiellaceae bacterium]|nr:excisionase family DNA-binding protein [Gaiellaceae bacterium]